MASTKRKPRSIDEYLTVVNADQRTVLENLRKTIRAAAPKAEECISYGIPAFRLNGRSLVFFGAWANHCSFYPGSSAALEKFQNELKGFQGQQGHDSLFSRQTTAYGAGEEARQSAAGRGPALMQIYAKNQPVLMVRW